MNRILQQLSQRLQDRDPRVLTGIAVALLVLTAAIWMIARWRRLTPDEVERRRREKLTADGRITDGVIVDARTLNGEDSVSPTPEVLVYSYRLAGVTYNCAQDVSLLADRVSTASCSRRAGAACGRSKPSAALARKNPW